MSGYEMGIEVTPPASAGMPWRAVTTGDDACTGEHADPYLAVAAAVIRKGYSFHQERELDGEATDDEILLWDRLMEIIREIPR